MPAGAPFRWFGGAAVSRLFPVGRHHQDRANASNSSAFVARGHPIVGMKNTVTLRSISSWPKAKPVLTVCFFMRGIFASAPSRNGEDLVLEAPIPPDCQVLLDALS